MTVKYKAAMFTSRDTLSSRDILLEAVIKVATHDVIALRSLRGNHAVWNGAELNGMTSSPMYRIPWVSNPGVFTSQARGLSCDIFTRRVDLTPLFS